MSKRLVIILACILVLGAIALGVWLFLSMKSATPPTTGEPTNPFGFSGASEPVTHSQTITTRDGTPVAVSAFTTNASSVPLSSDPTDVQYDLTPYGDYVPGQAYPTHEFDVEYNQKTSEFLVTLNQEPLGHARLAAEAFLRNKLGVTDADLCALNVTIRVPYTVNATYSNYRNLGPSTCTGAVKLP